VRRPNILILYTDQQRWDALGANGNTHIQTPNLDQLAASGVCFNHCFVQHPLCMPSRVSMLSGQYPSKLGITDMGVPVPQDLPTLPRLLKTTGYKTANIGKLHFLPHANRDHRTWHPAYGFDHLEISDEPGVYEDTYRAWVRNKLIASGRDLSILDHLSIGLPPATDVWYDLMGVADPVKHPDSGGRDDFEGATPFEADADLTHSAFVGEQTISYLNSQDGTQPFLCIAGFYSPHAPWIVPQQYLDLYNREALPLPSYPRDVNIQRPENSAEKFSDTQLRSARHGYYAMITEVDDYIGQILAALEAKDLAENTIVIFTSDHGEWMGDHLRYSKGYPGDDAVSRVPLIVRVPGMTTGMSSAMVEAVDILPTLLDLAGLQIPPHLQGHSFRHLLQNPVGKGRESVLMEATGWKNLRTNTYRYLFHADGREMLWHLESDPGEYMDVADVPEHQAALMDCRKRLLARIIQQERPLDRTWPY